MLVAMDFALKSNSPFNFRTNDLNCGQRKNQINLRNIITQDFARIAQGFALILPKRHSMQEFCSNGKCHTHFVNVLIMHTVVHPHNLLELIFFLDSKIPNPKNEGKNKHCFRCCWHNAWLFLMLSALKHICHVQVARMQ